ncbi:hypothetical protein EVAR_31258_1 [Eumeta japonica]|uniref:Craniofacial development protein 2 n=1 Tax=Eumeta variegata TaxID=151549 RepID=A0A4C1VZX0_EUMVA|nr:hypothetical protein EVAR_31258_1 [Eumeta japonica]
MRTRKVGFGTLNACGGINNKIDDVYELMKDRRMDVLCVNDTKMKDSGGATKHGFLESYWSGVEQCQRRCRSVGSILSERLHECVNSYSYAPDM